MLILSLARGSLLCGMTAKTRFINGRWDTFFFWHNPGLYFLQKPYSLVEHLGALITVG